MPGAGFKRQAQEWRKLNRAMLNEPFEMARQRVVRTRRYVYACIFNKRLLQTSGTAVPCFTATELESYLQSRHDPDHEQLIKDVAATTYAGDLCPVPKSETLLMIFPSWCRHCV